MTDFAFRAAVPVWGEGLSEEMNVLLAFTAAVPEDGAHLRLCAWSAWQLFVNGEFFLSGPARAGQGFFRAEEAELPAGEVRILVAAYNVPSYYLLDDPPFFCAELYAPDGTLIAASGDGEKPFGCARVFSRVQKTQRFTGARTFAEAYRLPAPETPIPAVPVGTRRFIARDVPVPEYERTALASLVVRGAFTVSDSEDDPGAEQGDLPGFDAQEQEVRISLEAERLRCMPGRGSLRADRIELAGGEYAVGDFGRELTGYISFEIETEGCRLVVTFDERLTDGDVFFRRCGNSCCAVVWDLGPGTWRLTAFEPNCVRYLKFAVTGRSVIRGAAIIRYEFPSAPILPPPALPDAQLARIYDAAVSTFRQNTVDIFMDCPSRERAGWLCDSFFTARTEYALTGESRVERAFLENFLMPASFPLLPEGMLPKAYPAIDRHGTFIPNWAMWYVLELEEYRFARGGDPALVEAARERMYGLLGYFRRFENEDGLLQRLESWIFLEWSHANNLTQDINYPTNMLYVRFKRALAALYGDDALREEADRLAEVIRARSFTGEWFCDNAVLRGGKAVLSGECTEVCQYYAFFTGVADPGRYPALWETLLRDFGPKRAATGAYPEIWPANPFIGYYLRLELLFRAGAYDEVLENIRGYFSAMAEMTGTLWEGTDDRSSCNHGFASHAAVWLRAMAEAHAV